MACGGCGSKRRKTPKRELVRQQPNPPDVTEAARGIGTLVAKLTLALNLPHCSKCEERRRRLNTATPAWLRKWL